MEHGRSSGDFNAELIHYAQGLLRAIDQGLAREVLPLLVASVEFQVIASFDAGTALCAALGGEHEQASARLARLTETGVRGGAPGADNLAPTAFLSHVAVLVGDIVSAEVLCRWLGRTSATVVRSDRSPDGGGRVDHHLGCLANVLGVTRKPSVACAAPSEIERSMGARPFAARTLAHLAAAVGGTLPRYVMTIALEARTEADSLAAEGIVAEVNGILDGSALS